MFSIASRLQISASIVVLAATAAACGGSESTGGSGGTSSSSSASSSSGATAAGGKGTGGTGGAAPKEYAAFVQGTLADAGDLAKAKATHDQIASAGEAQAKAAGDFAHVVLLGTTLLDSTENAFLAIDRWNDATAMQAFYADPQLQQAFAGLFAAPPTIRFYAYEPDWVSWGDMHSGDTFNPYFFHLADGTLKDTDVGKNKALHDQIASGGQQPAMGAGNLAHVVFLGLADQQQFNAVDIWGEPDNIEAFYTNPQFVQAFGALFSSVTQPVYQSTDWHQW